MQQSGGQPGHQSHETQPSLPSYAEAIRSAPPPSNLQYVHNNADAPCQSAPFYATGQTGPYPGHPSYGNQVIFPPPSSANFPQTYTSYPPYGQTADEANIAPTTITIIRPVPAQPESCCSGRSGKILGIVLGIVIVGAILRVTMHSYY